MVSKTARDSLPSNYVLKECACVTFPTCETEKMCELHTHQKKKLQVCTFFFKLHVCVCVK